MNIALDRLSPSITTMIRMDHTHVLAAFHRFKPELSPQRKQALVRHVCLAVQIHAQLEDEIFYPALREVLAGDETLEKSEPEHDEMRRLMDTLQTLDSEDPSFDQNFMTLMRTVIHHVADEETILLPAAEQMLRDRLGQLGAQMTKRRMQLLRPHAGEVASTAVQTFPGGAAAVALGAVAIGAMLFAGRGGDKRRALR